MRLSFVIGIVIWGFKLVYSIKKRSSPVCFAHFKPSDRYKTITGLTRLKAEAVPSQFAWTKPAKNAQKTNYKINNNMNEQQDRKSDDNLLPIHSDEGLTLEKSVFESFLVVKLLYRPCG